MRIPLRELQEFLARRPRLNKASNQMTRPLRNRAGVALVVAIAAVALITYLAMEVMYDTTVEYTVNSQALNRLKAYYAARSGLEISLLRLKIYQTVMSQHGEQIKKSPMAGMIDQIWQFPLSWPISIPSALNSVDTDMLKDTTKESIMDANFETDIRDEGSRLDLNDLVSRSKTLRELAKKRLMDIFKQKLEQDEKFSQEYGNFKFDELINNIADWMSDKNSSANGGDKRSGYEELNKEKEAYPPNRGFRTLQELHLVKGMTDVFYDMIAPSVTIYGMRGVNPNVASKEVLKSLDVGITDAVAEKIIARRDNPQKGPFSDKDDFWKFVEGEGQARLQNKDYKDIPLFFDGLSSFRITSRGKFASAERTIDVIVVDLAQTAKRIKTYIDKDKQAESGGAGAGGAGGAAAAGPPAATKNDPLPKGGPRIVYWSER